MNLDALLGQALGPNTIGQLSQALGESRGTTQNAVQAAVPVLLGALAGNTRSGGGAASLLSALDRDHDGSILDDLGGLLGGAGGGSALAGQGASILGHILGNKQAPVATGISQASGMSADKVMQLLAMLAPIVMGVLGRAKQGGALPGGGDLGSVLAGAAQSMGGGNAGGLLGGLGSLLDQNKDGSPLDDVMGMMGGLLGGGKR
jgi:hypothetical protein